MLNKKILITGGTGSLGQMLCKNLKCELIRVYSRDEFKQKHSFQADHIRYILGDVRDKERLDMAMEEIDIVIHCAALKQIDTGEYNPFEFIKTNINGTQNVIDLVVKRDMRLVYISTNAVFDGKCAPYEEDDLTNPINRYGHIKVKCEEIVTRMCPEAIIIRPILMYGWHVPQGRLNPVTWIIDRLQRGEKSHLVTDVYENPLLSYNCAESIWRAIQLKKRGTFHIAGKEVVNRYEFGRLVAESFDLDASLLYPVSSSFFPTIAPRPHNTSFLTKRMQVELGMEPISLHDGLQRMRAVARDSGLH